MRKTITLVASGALLAGCSTTLSDSSYAPTAEASQVLAAEAALLADARERGVWDAFETALAEDAVIFMPHAVAGKDRARSNPETVNPKEWAWNTQSVTMSCDGSMALVRGEVVTGRDFEADYFSIWERAADGRYELAADAAFYQGDGPEVEDLETLGNAQESAVTQRSYSTSVARCTGEPGSGAAIKGPARYSGISADGTMRWTLSEAPDGSSNLEVEGRGPRGYRTVLSHDFPAPPNR